MKILRLINKATFFLFFFLKFKSIKLSFYLAYFNVALKSVSKIKKINSFIVFPNNNRINYYQLPKFLFSINLLFELLSHKDVIVSKSLDDSFCVEINGLSFNVSSLSNMAVLYEIYIQKIYNVNFNYDDVVLVDIGMNVGVASLYFANQKNVKVIYGFEPFPDTYNEALMNASLNSKLKDKLNFINKGVSDKTEIKTIDLYDSGLLSASTLNSENNFGKKIGKKITVEIVSAIDLMNDIFNQYPSNKIILKVDCEGEEYAFFESLNTTNYFDNIVCIIVEWQEKGPERITKILIDKGFQFFQVDDANFNAGLIYAFKN